MFRTLIYPSSGACDYSVELPHWSILLGSMCVVASVCLCWSGIRVAGLCVGASVWSGIRVAGLCVGVSVWLVWSGIHVAG